MYPVLGYRGRTKFSSYLNNLVLKSRGASGDFHRHLLVTTKFYIRPDWILRSQVSDCEFIITDPGCGIDVVRYHLYCVIA
eukprot:SAG11_NODE_3429_length_2454_cov_1.570276_2_plen_80_part_00